MLTKPWRTWARKSGLKLFQIPGEEFRRMQERYDKLPDGLEREVFRGEWAQEQIAGPKDKLIYGLGNTLCLRTKHGWTPEEYQAWEYFVLEDVWRNGVTSSSVDWSADHSQLLCVGENREAENPGLKRHGYVNMFRIEDQPIHVVRTWAVHWTKTQKRAERIDTAMKEFSDYINFGSWSDKK